MVTALSCHQLNGALQGRNYLSDQKEFQINTLQDNIRNINIELLDMNAKLHGGEPQHVFWNERGQRTHHMV
jgi:hypothetical protein